MAGSSVLAFEIPVTLDRQPRDDELDLFGLTHVGNVRTENEDQFLVCTVHPQLVVHGTSVPIPEQLPLQGERVATILLVADGVGGERGGREASALATQSVTKYLMGTLRCYHAVGTTSEDKFVTALRDAALGAHEEVLADTVDHPEVHGMATTLTLAIVTWPWAYVVQVGDSRCYHFSGGRLLQVTKDQTMAQELVDMGALPAAQIGTSRFSHILTSALGGSDATPVVTRFEMRRDSVLLLCSDGLTKHVTDDEIADHLRTMESSAQAGRALVNLALERGGSDNITVIVRRAKEPGLFLSSQNV